MIPAVATAVTIMAATLGGTVIVGVAAIGAAQLEITKMLIIGMVQVLITTNTAQRM